MQAFLREVAELLNEKGFYTKLLPESENNPSGELVVQLGEDYKQRGLNMEILFVPNTDQFDVLQFFILLPFKVQTQVYSDMARFVVLLNEQLPLGYLGLSEPHAWVYYRHFHPCVKTKIGDEMILNIVNMMHYMGDTLCESVEQVASGTLDYDTAKIEFTERITELMSRLEKNHRATP